VPGNYPVFALVQIGAPSVPALIDTLDDKDEHTRKAACVALGKLGSTAEDALPALKSLTGTFSLAPGSVKDVARMAIRAIEANS
jgi:HEAT repeat protein